MNEKWLLEMCSDGASAATPRRIDGGPYTGAATVLLHVERPALGQLGLWSGVEALPTVQLEGMPLTRRTQPVRDGVARWLRRRSTAAGLVVRTADELGFHQWSLKVARVTGLTSLVVVGLPSSDQHGARTITMDSIDDRDQSALALQQSWDAFEAPAPAVFLVLCEALNGIVLDVGANTGIYSLYAAGGACRSVVAFEPVPAIADMMQRNVALSKLQERVEIRRCAVGSQLGRAEIYLPPDDGGYIETSASLAPNFKEVLGSQLTVPVTTLDSWYRSAGRPRVSIVKIDVESREADVLAGAEELTHEQLPILLVEVLPQGDIESVAEFVDRHRMVDIRLYPDRLVVGRVGERPAFDPNSWNHLFVPESTIIEVSKLLVLSGFNLVSGPRR